MGGWLAEIDFSAWYGWALTADGWISLLTLTFLEIVLGIDNLVFLTIASQRLPKEQRPLARRIGLSGALVLRILMLLTLVWLTRLRTPAFSAFGLELSWSDLIFLAGGAFLLWKGTGEIHHEMEGKAEDEADIAAAKGKASFAGVIFMIMVIDFVFALDSIITAVGLSQFIPVMIIANIIAIVVMLAAADPIGRFIEKHPTVKMLALAFILLVGVALIADGLHIHIPRGFIYFAIAFSLGVETLNILAKARREKRRAEGVDA